MIPETEANKVKAYLRRTCARCYTPDQLRGETPASLVGRTWREYGRQIGPDVLPGECLKIADEVLEEQRQR